MLSILSDYQINVCLEPVDMRKSIDGLIAKVVDYFTEEVQSKTLFVFCNKGRDR